MAATLLLSECVDEYLFSLQFSSDRFGLCSSTYDKLLPRFLCQAGDKLFPIVQVKVDLPVLLRDKASDLRLAITQEPQSDRLHPSRGEPLKSVSRKSTGEERAHLVTDEPIEDPPCSLRRHLVEVDLLRIFKSL